MQFRQVTSRSCEQSLLSRGEPQWPRTASGREFCRDARTRAYSPSIRSESLEPLVAVEMEWALAVEEL